jgi:AcrR family transcriptional regulator
MKAVNLCSSQIDSWLGMKKRSYVSHARAAGAAETRDKVVRAAIAFLRHKDIARFSLDAVAKAAGVTRLTVYNQFGSRRGLLEAVFDEIARSGGLARIPQAMAKDDPLQALNALVDVFCDFWSVNEAMGRLHDAVGLDPEFGEAVNARNERRRGALTRLVERMNLSGSASARRDAVDLIFTLTGYAVYRSLAATKSNKAIRKIIKAASADAIERVRNGPERN